MSAPQQQTEDNQSGGWLEPEYGYINNNAVTFALGWGDKEGEILLADGHIDTARPGPFWDGGHKHFGKEQGPNPKVKDRGICRADA